MSIYYVSTNGNDRGDGSAASPWRTISHAVRQDLDPGDEVVVRPGTYRESVEIGQGGSPSGHVTLRSEVPGEALIRAPSNTWNAISINDDYVIVDGFDVQGAGGGDGIEANDVHHVKVLNNVSHGNGESGIQFNWSEFITIEGNVTYDNASDGWFSGISIYQNRNITGDRSTDGFRTIVRDNVSYDNVTKTGQHTDGNGIIIDDFQSTQTGGHPNYTYPTLVENNLVYNNGGKGIQVVWSDGVTVRGNTAYHNNLDPRNDGTWRGELSNSQSSGNTWVNNIAVADPSRNPDNRAIDDTSYGGYSNDDVVWKNNLTFDGTAGRASVRTDGDNAGPRPADGNLLGVDPRFVKPGSDFDLRADSPAIDAGTRAFGHASRDLDGDARTIGQLDMGAQEHGAGGRQQPAPKPKPEPEPANRAPNAEDDAGFRTPHETELKIDAADLLRNDSDPDGHALSLRGVSAERGGAAKLDAAGNVTFTPADGFSGSARLAYTVSDGRGGSDRASVSVDVAKASVANAAPVAVDDAGYTAASGAPVRIPHAALLANDRDDDVDALIVTKVGAASNGRVQLDGRDVVFTPRAGAEGEGGFTYTVSDGNGGRATAKVAVSIEAGGGGGGGKAETESFWDEDARPAQVTDEDRNAVELGLKFRADVDGEILAIRFFEGPRSDGAHPVTLWSASGDELASASFSGAAGAGWREVAFDRPVAIEADDVHVASYHAPEGGYSADTGYFDRAISDGHLTALKNAGVYDYGPAGSFPDQSYQASNYWIDVVFRAEEPGGPAPRVEATHQGGGGRDRLVGSEGADLMLGGGGDDLIKGRTGADVLRGQNGNDRLLGGDAADVLIGGRGNDKFVFRRVDRDDAPEPDVIRAGDGAAAFGGVGGGWGDRIDVRQIDADATQKGNQAFTFGETGPGGLWLSEEGGKTVVRANVDRDASSELAIVIEDGAVLASQYTAADFIL